MHQLEMEKTTLVRENEVTITDKIVAGKLSSYIETTVKNLDL